jgi:hypothetical protein
VLRLRLPIIGITAAAVFGGASLLTAGAASAADTITITNVGSPIYINIGHLSVTVVAGSPLTNLDVRLLNSDNSVALELPFSDFTASGTGINGNATYTVTTPITTSQLPLGTYAVSISAADTGGGSLTDDNVGDWSFVNEPELRLSVRPLVLDYGHQSITMSGTATLLGTNETSAALANWPVSLNYDGADGHVHSALLTTDASGNFQTTVSSLLPATTTVSATVAATNTMGAGSAQTSLTFYVDPVTVTASLSPASVNYGKSTILSGTATYVEFPSGTLPLANTGLTVSSSQPGFAPVSVQTNASGQYTFVTPAEKANANWAVTLSATSWLLAAQASANMTVNLPSRVTGFTGSLSPFAGLSFNACLNVTVPQDHAAPGPITYQWSAKPRGPWRNLGLVGPSKSKHCPGTTQSESASFNAPRPSAYYRAISAGGGGFEYSASNVIHLWKYLTRITGFAATPHRASHHGAITVSGRLWQHVGTWKPLAGQRVKVYFACGNTVYVYVHPMTTNAGGYFSGRYGLRCTGPWLTQYNGNATRFASDSAVIQITQASGAIAAGSPAGTVISRVSQSQGSSAPGLGVGAVSLDPSSQLVASVRRLASTLRQLP